MLLLYVVAYLDRINVSFAGLQMNRDLGFSDEVFGIGASAFFIGYFLFGVPSNIMVEKLGARRWISTIMVAWGIVSTSMSMVHDINWFYFLRFMLGVAEAGFFPGMILYLTYWFPKKEHGKAVARFMTAVPLAGVLGGIISSRVLLMNGIMGLPGWKWLFLITGFPAILLGISVLFLMDDGPSKCKWLSDDEREWIIDNVSRDTADKKSNTGKSAISEKLQSFSNIKVWHLTAIYFCLSLGMYGFQLWLPQIIQSFDKLDDSTTALLSAVPAAFQAIGMLVIAGSSDRRQERRWHIAGATFIAATGLMACGFCHNPIISLACLCLSAFGIWGTVGPFWAVPTSYLSAGSAGAGIALINSGGSLGASCGPYIVGFIRTRSSDFVYSLAALAVSLVVAGLLALAIRQQATNK